MNVIESRFAPTLSRLVVNMLGNEYTIVAAVTVKEMPNSTMYRVSQDDGAPAIAASVMFPLFLEEFSDPDLWCQYDKDYYIIRTNNEIIAGFGSLMPDLTAKHAKQILNHWIVDYIFNHPQDPKYYGLDRKGDVVRSAPRLSSCVGFTSMIPDMRQFLAEMNVTPNIVLDSLRRIESLSSYEIMDKLQADAGEIPAWVSAFVLNNIGTLRDELKKLGLPGFEFDDALGKDVEFSTIRVMTDGFEGDPKFKQPTVDGTFVALRKSRFKYLHDHDCEETPQKTAIKNLFKSFGPTAKILIKVQSKWESWEESNLSKSLGIFRTDPQLIHAQACQAAVPYLRKAGIVYMRDDGGILVYRAVRERTDKIPEVSLWTADPTQARKIASIPEGEGYVLKDCISKDGILHCYQFDHGHILAKSDTFPHGIVVCTRLLESQINGLDPKVLQRNPYYQTAPFKISHLDLNGVDLFKNIKID